MVEAVFIFAVVSAMFEMALLMKLPPRIRLRLLGSDWLIGAVHVFIIWANIAIHFGTVTGTMTAVTAGLTSFAVIPFAKWISGYITGGRYFAGRLKYSLEEIR
jgi:hypothetical protein